MNWIKNKLDIKPDVKCEPEKPIFEKTFYDDNKNLKGFLIIRRTAFYEHEVLNANKKQIALHRWPVRVDSDDYDFYAKYGMKQGLSKSQTLEKKE